MTLTFETLFKIKSRGENIYDLDKVFTNYPDISLTSNNSILIQGQCTSSAQLTKGLFGWIISQTWTKASETIIPTWTFHIFFVMILTLHLENFGSRSLYTLLLWPLFAQSMSKTEPRKDIVLHVYGQGLYTFFDQRHSVGEE